MLGEASLIRMDTLYPLLFLFFMFTYLPGLIEHSAQMNVRNAIDFIHCQFLYCIHPDLVSYKHFITTSHTI